MPDYQPRGLRRTRAVAGGLLLAMAGLFLLALRLRADYPAFAYVQAFAEAALVGGLADWFAVTALFRRPLGLPIPHTAVIPRNKERIGESLGRFVEQHFLPPEVIRARLAEVDFAGQLAAWLRRPDNAGRLAGQLAGALAHLLPQLADERLRDLVRDRLCARLEAADMTPFAARLLAALTADNRHQSLLDAALSRGAAFIAEKEPFIRQTIRDHTGWLWQKLGLDERAYNAIMNAIEGVLADLEADASHELRQRFDQAVRNFIRDLEASPRYREQAEAIKRELLRSPAFRDGLGQLWEEMLERLRADAAAPDSATRRRLQAALAGLGESLAADAGGRAALNAWLREAVAGLLEARRADIARLIPDTVRNWDGRSMTERLEAQVGKDLQFIRINGTLVGGLVGVLIYAVSRALA